MVKPGIHYPRQFVTVVLRNGATFQMSSIVQMTQPIFLEKDPTNNPVWTGKQVQDIKEESRAAKFLEKFGKMGLSGGSSS